MTGRRFAELVDDTLAASEIAADIGVPIATVLRIACRLGRLPIQQQVRLCGSSAEPSKTSAPADNRRAG